MQVLLSKLRPSQELQPRTMIRKMLQEKTALQDDRIDKSIQLIPNIFVSKADAQ
jgi:hypothetical protein